MADVLTSAPEFFDLSQSAGCTVLIISLPRPSIKDIASMLPMSTAQYYAVRNWTS